MRKYWGEVGYGKKHYEENRKLYIDRANEYRAKYPEKAYFVVLKLEQN